MIDILKEAEERSPIHRTVIAIIIGIALILFFFIMYNETPMTKGNSTFYLSSSSSADIKETLEENGYELNTLDRIAMMFVKTPSEGWYEVGGNEVGRFSFWKDLHQNQTRTINLVIFAGETSEETFRRIARDMLLSKTKLAQHHKILSRFKEGNILAGKYTLARSADEEMVIRYLLEQSNQEFDFFATEQYGSDFNETQLREAMIIASIIQKESNDVKEMSYISSVIQNRLKKDMKLQMDGTLNYGKYCRTIVTPERIRTDKSRYNTYKYKGLPPAPLSIISMDALEAAAFPRESDYLFFVLNKSGKHNFSNTYKKHLIHVKAFKAHLKEREAKKKQLKKKETVKAKKTEVALAEEKKKKPVVKKVPQKRKIVIKTEPKKEASEKNSSSHVQTLFSEINVTKK